MSTPASNTRSRTRNISSKSNLSCTSKESQRVETNVNNLEQQRTKKCERKAQILKVKEEQSQSRVRKWLQTSQLANTQAAKLNATAVQIVQTTKEVWQSVTADKADKEDNTYRVNADEEISFIVNKQTSASSKDKKRVAQQPFNSPQNTLELTSNRVNMANRPSEILRKLRQKLTLTHDDFTQEKGEWGHNENEPNRQINWDEGEANRDEIGQEQNELDDQNSQTETSSQNEEVTEENGSEDLDQTAKNTISDSQLQVLQKYKDRLNNDDKSVFFDMFELLITKMSVIENSITNLKTQQKEVNKKVRDFETSLSFADKSVQDLAIDVNEIAQTNATLIETTIKCEQTLNIVDQSVENLSRSIKKGEFLLYGVEKDDEKTEITLVQEFLKQMLEVEVVVISAHSIGKKLNSPIWFKIQDNDKIALIFKNASKLKGKQNRFKQRYSVREFTTDKAREENQRNQDLKADNRRLPISHQAEMKKQGANLLVNGQKYKKEIAPPTLKEILIDSNVQHDMKKAGVYKGQFTTENGSAFYSYIMEASSFEEIKR